MAPMRGSVKSRHDFAAAAVGCATLESLSDTWDAAVTDVRASAATMSESEEPIEIPHDALSPTALRAVIESFILREGTDYGECEVPLEWKVASVLRQLERGEAQVIFDPASETVDIVVKRAPGTNSSP
jgi:uncharacterized protein